MIRESAILGAQLNPSYNFLLVPLMVYGDILWGLFNSTEFAFNH